MATKTAPAPTTAKKAMGKTALHKTIATTTGLERGKVAEVLNALALTAATELGKRGPGQIVIPGLVRLKVTRKPATKARQGRNPFTGEAMTIAAKPARNAIRATPVKALKDSV